jgi:dolichol-phosphate mannosyltransferase
LLASIIILLSPIGFFVTMFFLIWPNRFNFLVAFTKRQYTFVFITITIPLSIFLVFSFTKEIKLNWTSPIWIAVIPFLAATLSQVSSTLKNLTQIRFFKAWKTTIIFFLLAYGGILQYFSIGLPGIPYVGEGPLFGWRNYAAQIDGIADSIELRTGERPSIVGMDEYKTASGLAFYRTLRFEEESATEQKNPLTETLGRSLLGREAVMYGYWFPAFQKQAKPLLVLSPDKEDLERKWVEGKAQDIGEIQVLETTKNNLEVGPIFYRLVNIKEQNMNTVSLNLPHKN